MCMPKRLMWTINASYIMYIACLLVSNNDIDDLKSNYNYMLKNFVCIFYVRLFL